MQRFHDPVPNLKRRVADEINTLLSGWTQEYAAAFLGESSSRISELRRLRLEKYSLDRLVRLLGRLGREIEVVTRPTGQRALLAHREVDGFSDGERRGGPKRLLTTSGMRRTKTGFFREIREIA